MTRARSILNRLSRRGGALLLLVLTLPAFLAGQGRRDDSALYEPIPAFRVEAVNAPAADPALSRLDIRLWLQPSFLVFVRNAGDTSATPFAGTAEISIEVFDSTRTLRYQKYLRRRLSASTSDASAIPDDPVAETFTASLPPGAYAIAAEVGDAESQRRSTRSLNVRLSAFGAGDALQASSLLWCRPTAGLPSGERSEDCFGDIIPLGQAAAGYVSCLGVTRPESALAVVRVYRLRAEQPVRALLLADTVRADANPGFVPFPDTISGGRYSFPGFPAVTALTFVLPFRSDTLPLGTYAAEVTIIEGARRSTKEQRFAIAWPGMPRSLSSLRTAARPLQYLMTKEEFALFRDLAPEAQREAFERFWRGKNPAPERASNDVMGEFYRRVDVATGEFTTIRQPDGAMTDRGKVYILFGPPSTRERVLGTASAPREVWYYQNTRKSVIFIDAKRTGDYTLVTEQ